MLCNEVNDKVVQHFVQCIETRGKHVQVSIFPEMQYLSSVLISAAISQPCTVHYPAAGTGAQQFV